MDANKNYDIEAKTILHYSNKIIEFCSEFERCSDCPLHDLTMPEECHFGGRPFKWKEVDIHE